MLESRRVWEEAWPEPDPDVLRHETFMLVVQVNGKLRDRVEVDANASEEKLLELARASDNVKRHLDEKSVVKEIIVPGKLVNLVVR
jgi:leucyl-tRNA synthetase